MAWLAFLARVSLMPRLVDAWVRQYLFISVIIARDEISTNSVPILMAMYKCSLSEFKRVVYRPAIEEGFMNFRCPFHPCDHDDQVVF